MCELSCRTCPLHSLALTRYNRPVSSTVVANTLCIAFTVGSCGVRATASYKCARFFCRRAIYQGARYIPRVLCCDQFARTWAQPACTCSQRLLRGIFGTPGAVFEPAFYQAALTRHIGAQTCSGGRGRTGSISQPRFLSRSKLASVTGKCLQQGKP